ncbi:dnaJ homolog subfamily C member 27 isoform X1 [Taeniopygia guttata]|uniref:dnaJ homolog subfamily C member 27 isoform X1 n=1 Tax=Taeniopygia guttata TaxID=59729 RepID=UPI003BB8D46C
MEASAAKRKEPRKALRVKVISMGNAEVGKSCIIKRYCEKRFVPKYLATIGIDYGVTKVQIRDREIKVNIFDMAGHPFFYEVRNEFYRDTQGVLLVYDVGSKDSFEALDSWLAEMRRELGPQGSLDSVVVAVCANKVDAGKLRVVDESEGRLWAESRGFLYWETSAQSGEGIQEMFQNFYSAIVELCENGGKRPAGGSGVGFTREQADAIRRIRASKDSWDVLGLKPGASRSGISGKKPGIPLGIPAGIPAKKGGGDPRLPPAGRAAAPRQVSGSGQRGRLQGPGQRPRRAAPEPSVAIPARNSGRSPSGSRGVGIPRFWGVIPGFFGGYSHFSENFSLFFGGGYSRFWGVIPVFPTVLPDFLRVCTVFLEGYSHFPRVIPIFPKVIPIF